MMRDALAHLVSSAFCRGMKKASRAWRILRSARAARFCAARASGYQRYGAHPLLSHAHAGMMITRVEKSYQFL